MYRLVLLLLLIPLVHAHGDEIHGESEIKFSNGYVISYTPGDNFEFSITNEMGNSVHAELVVEIYKSNKLFTSRQVQSDGEYFVMENNLPNGFYEIRPVFIVDNSIASAGFEYSRKGILEMIIEFFTNLFGIKEKNVHAHADFLVAVNGERYNFSRPEYMTHENSRISGFVHLHDMDGNVIHKHAAGINLAHFFGTLGIGFNSTCFGEYCNNSTSALRLYVNGEPNDEYGGYEFKDLDRILITYGDYTQEEISSMISSVTDEACIQSEKCPEKGQPSNESSCSAGECSY